MPDRPSRYSLNQKQLYLLKLLYKFRFLTAPLLAQIKNISSIAANKQLRLLLEQEYLGMRYDETYKIDRKAPIFYVTKKAISLLAADPALSTDVLHMNYHNPNTGEPFMQQHLDVVRSYLALRLTYPDRFQIYSKYETTGYDYFPPQKPDLYLRLNVPDKSKSMNYLLYVLPVSQFFVTKKLVVSLLEHFDEGEWDAQTGEPYPTLLFVCTDGSTEKKLLHHLNDEFENTGIDDLNVLVTTIRAIFSEEQAIWTNPVEPELLSEL